MSDQVTAPKPAGVGNPTPGSTGVANQDATTQVGNSDGDLRERLQALEQSLETTVTKYEEDMRKQKAAIQSSHAAEVKRIQAQYDAERQQYVNQMRQLQLQAADEEDRDAYIRRFQAEDTQAVQRQLEDALAQLEAARQAPVNLQAAAALGLDVTNIDVSNEDAMYNSLWSGIGEQIASLRAEKEKLLAEVEAAKSQPQGQPAPGDPNKPAPEPVLTAQYSTPTGQTTLEDVRKAVSAQSGKEVTLDEMFTIAEQRPDLEQRLRELTASQE